MTIYDQIFKGREVPSPHLLRTLRVSGGSTALLEKLRRDINYDGIKILSTGIFTTDPAGIIKSTSWTLLGAVKTVTISASKIWKDAEKNTQVVFRFPDLSVFEFPSMSNVSAWCERDQLDIRFVDKSKKTVIDWETATGMGVGDLCVRALVVPGSIREASVWITVSPLGKAELVEMFTLAGVNDPAIPHISLPIEEMDEGSPHTFSAGKAVTATLIHQEPPNSGLGMGVLPFLETTSADTEDQGLPDPIKFKEASLKFFRSIHMGHPTTANSYDAAVQKFQNHSVSNKKAPVIFPEFLPTAAVTGQSLVYLSDTVMHGYHTHSW